MKLRFDTQNYICILFYLGKRLKKEVFWSHFFSDSPAFNGLMIGIQVKIVSGKLNSTSICEKGGTNLFATSRWKIVILFLSLSQLADLKRIDGLQHGELTERKVQEFET